MLLMPEFLSTNHRNKSTLLENKDAIKQKQLCYYECEILKLDHPKFLHQKSLFTHLLNMIRFLFHLDLYLCKHNHICGLWLMRLGY